MEKIPAEIRSAWIEEENKKLSDGKRKYLHFDFRISRLTKKYITDIQTPNLVIRHSFYPLIRREKKWRRYKKSLGQKNKLIMEKIRPISYASHFDSLVHSWYSFVLSYFYEKKIKSLKIDGSIQAYRKIGKKCNIDFAKEVFAEIKKQNECAILCLDLEKFFDNLDHSFLKTQWAKIIKEDKLPEDHYFIFRNITNFTFINYKDLKLSIKELILDRLFKHRFCSPAQFRKIIKEKKLIRKNENEKAGIPQGSTISALLSNLYMLDFDNNVKKFVDGISGIYRRYSDDIIIICPISELESLEKFLETEVKKIKININESKTERKVYKNINEVGQIFNYPTLEIGTLQYLGFEFDGNKIYLRHSGIANFQRKMSRTIKKLVLRSRRLNRMFPKKKILYSFYYSRKSNYLSYARRSSSLLVSDSIKRQILPKKVMGQIKRIRKKFEANQD